MAVCNPADPAACDDGNPCTDDVCVGGARCDNTPRTGLEAITCTCSAPLPGACADDSIPVSVQRLSTRACRLFAQVASSATKGRRHRLRQGANTLQKAIVRITRGEDKGRIGTDCAVLLYDRYGTARDRARALAVSP